MNKILEIILKKLDGLPEEKPVEALGDFKLKTA